MARFKTVVPALTTLIGICILVAANARFVDRYRELKDVNTNNTGDRSRRLEALNAGEEEVGQLGREWTVIIAEAKDSKTAKATSAVHVPHADSKTADHQTVNIEETWNDDDIKSAQALNDGSKNVTVSTVTPNSGEDGQQQEVVPEVEQPYEPSEEELELQRIEEENTKINEAYEEYANLNADEETKKIQEKEMAKNKKKAEIHLLEPRARLSENRGIANKEPCGGTVKGPIHFMASAGSRNFINWKTVKAHKNSNCTLSLSTGSENIQDFKVLQPRDNSADWQGSFPCGREAGFEGKEFRFPNDISCPSCILKFSQEISADEQIHQCADIVILENIFNAASISELKAQREMCGGICKNGGQCRNGECLCRDGFEGAFCDEEEESVNAELIFFFFITLILVVAALLFWKGKEAKKFVEQRFSNERQAQDANL